jgi:hypothetical protein
VSNLRKIEALALALVLVCMGAAYFGGTLAHAKTITRTVKVEKTWGAPTQSVDGAQVSQALAGLTCDVFQSRKTVVCHP